MAVRFSITEKGSVGFELIRCFLQDRIAIGRARSSDICLPDMAVSTRHAEIGLKSSSYVVTDLGSLNGTSVNGNKLTPYRPRTLKDGDVIGIACFDLTFLSQGMPGLSEPRDASIRQAREILADILARTGRDEQPPTLVISAGPSKGSRYILPKAPSKISIGRSQDAEVVLEDRDVSRKHAEIIIEADRICLRDLNSRNGIFIGAEKMDTFDLEPGTSFRLGQTTMVLEHPLQRSLAAIFNAPEEETSSFSIDVFSKPQKTDQNLQLTDPAHDAIDKDISPPEVNKPAKPLGVGPTDPLTSRQDAPISRTTAQILRPEQTHGSDLGLIVIGAIILVAAVLGLVYLFT